MERTAIVQFKGVANIGILECLDSPRCRYVIRGKQAGMTVYLHDLPGGYLWHRATEYEGERTVCEFASREEAENFLHDKGMIPALKDEQEEFHPRQAA